MANYSYAGMNFQHESTGFTEKFESVTKSYNYGHFENTTESAEIAEKGFSPKEDILGGMISNDSTLQSLKTTNTEESMQIQASNVGTGIHYATDNIVSSLDNTAVVHDNPFVNQYSDDRDF
jgi:hypothetical protein